MLELHLVDRPLGEDRASHFNLILAPTPRGLPMTFFGCRPERRVTFAAPLAGNQHHEGHGDTIHTRPPVA